MIVLPRTCRLVVAIVVVLLFAGCGAMKLGKEPEARKGVVSIHPVSAQRDANTAQQPIYYARGRTAYVNLRPVVASPVIHAIESYPVPGGRGLVLHLDPTGIRAWQMAVGRHNGRHLALLIDGKFRAFLPITDASGGDRIRLGGPFRADEAEMLVEHAEANYKQD